MEFNKLNEIQKDMKSECTQITSLPDNLTVGGNLDMEGCTHATPMDEFGKWIGDILFSEKFQRRMYKSFFIVTIILLAAKVLCRFIK